MMKEQPLARGSVMVVDDNMANLKLLEYMLEGEGYEVRPFPRGRLALAAATQNPPDLILLDINMPEMNGYEVCERLKSNAHISGIPVIFLSALNTTEDKIKGFRCGAVDYISKPFQLEEVRARVETHVKLRRAQQAEHDLLENTLNDAISTLWELIQLTSPGLASRSWAIRDIVRWIAKRLELSDAWQYELAATLCLVGCITLPNETFEKAYGGHNLSPEEDQMFRAHPERAAGLLLKIPRLEVIADMIRMQQAPPADSSTFGAAMTGARMLHLALELDSRLYRGVHFRSALDQLRISPSRHEPAMLAALESYPKKSAEFELRSAFIRELRAGMMLEQDVQSGDGLLILKGGTILSETWIERLSNFAKTKGVQEPLRVRLVRPTNPDGPLGRSRTAQLPVSG